MKLVSYDFFFILRQNNHEDRYLQIYLHVRVISFTPYVCKLTRFVHLNIDRITRIKINAISVIVTE